MQDVVTVNLWLLSDSDLLHPEASLSRDDAETLQRQHGGTIVEVRLPITLVHGGCPLYSTSPDRPIVKLCPDFDLPDDDIDDDDFEPEPDSPNLGFLDNSVVAFVKQCCRLDPTGKVSNTQLRESYIRFCNRFGHYPVSQNALTRQLETLEVFSRRTSSKRYKVGITLLRTAA